MESSELDSNIAPVDQDFGSVHGVNIEDPSQPILLYRDKRSTDILLRTLSSGSIVMCVLTVIIIVLIALIMICQIVLVAAGHGLPADVIILLIVAAVLPVLCLRFLAKTVGELSKPTDPIISILPEGLKLQLFSESIDLIPWSEVLDVKATSYLSRRCLSIYPKDINKATANTSISMRLCVRAYLFLAPVRKLFKSDVAPPISVLEESMPLSVDEVIELINARKAYYLGLQSEQRTMLESEPGGSLLDDVSGHDRPD